MSWDLVGEEGQSGAAGITGSLLLSASLLTSDEVLLGRAVDASQVAVVLPAVLLGVLPGVPPAEVTVAVAVELPPGVVAALGVWVGVGNTAVSHEVPPRGQIPPLPLLPKVLFLLTLLSIPSLYPSLSSFL